MSEAENTRRMLWRFAPMIYGPTILFGLGEGAFLPMLPVIAASLGADLSQAALVAAVIVVARMLGNIPAGWAVSRIGERWTMALAAVTALIGIGGVLLARDLTALCISVFAIGLCVAAFGLARHAFMTTRVPLAFRGRALSVLGGSFRLGMFAGPFVAAALIAWTGESLTAAWFFGVCLIGLILLVSIARDPEEELAAAGSLPAAGRVPAAEHDQRAADGVLRTMWRSRGILLRLGLSTATLSGMRQARVYLLPLWGVSLGMDAQAISLVVGITGALEFALFYSSGQIMDRWGRLWACVPAMLLMGAAFLGLAFTHDLDHAETWFLVGAVVVGIGNGVSSGILMTLGADVAPPSNPAPFLGSWRILSDAGGAAVPLLITAITAIVSLSFATAVIGAIGLVGAVGFAVYVPRYVPRREPA